MKQRAFFILCFLLITVVFNGLASEKATDTEKKQIYEWRIYTLKGDGASLDNFFKETLIPAYNRQNISVGAFSLYKIQERDQRYLLFVYPDIETYYKVKQAIRNDQVFLKAAAPFYEKTAPAPVYSDYVTYLCEAFDKMPVMRIPEKSSTLFEYRLYQSPNDDANMRKVKMFNVEEIDLFDKVGVNSVCYGEVLAGANMPALIYLTHYKDESTRSETWDRFRAHPDWHGMKDKPEYKNTATNNQSKLLSPTSYSQF